MDKLGRLFSIFYPISNVKRSREERQFVLHEVFSLEKNYVVYMIQFRSIILLISREGNLKDEFVTPVLAGQANNAAES